MEEINRVGDFLKKGLSEEILNGEQAGNYSSLKCAIITLVLKGYLKQEELKEIVALIDKANTLIDKEELLDEIIEFLSNGLKKSFPFKSSEDFFEQLNEVEIPYSMLFAERYLWDIMSQAYVVDDSLYYIVKYNDINFFRQTKLYNLMGCNHFSYSLFEDSYSDAEEVEDGPYGDNYTISHSYNRILGFNPEKRVLYLQSSYLKESYTEYYIDTRQEEKVYHDYCYGVANNKYPIVKNRNKIALIMDDGSKKDIKEIKDYEEYEAKENYILVNRKDFSNRYFRPYRLYYSGEIDNAPYKYALKSLLSDISFDICYYACRRELLDFFKEHEFTLSNFLLFFKENYEIVERLKTGRYYYILIEKLMKYFDDDQNCLDLFCEVLDIALRTKEGYKSAIGVEVCKAISNMEESGELNSCRNNVQEFKRILGIHIPINEKYKKKKEEDKKAKLLIGCFKEVDGEIVANKTTREFGKFYGNQLVPQRITEPGVVSYNKADKCFYIQYNRLLSDDELLQISDEFGLEDQACKVIVEETE